MSQMDEKYLFAHPPAQPKFPPKYKYEIPPAARGGSRKGVGTRSGARDRMPDASGPNSFRKRGSIYFKIQPSYHMRAPKNSAPDHIRCVVACACQWAQESGKNMFPRPCNSQDFVVTPPTHPPPAKPSKTKQGGPHPPPAKPSKTEQNQAKPSKGDPSPPPAKPLNPKAFAALRPYAGGEISDV